MTPKLKAALRDKVVDELLHYSIIEHGLPTAGDLRLTVERVADRLIAAFQPEIERLVVGARRKEAESCGFRQRHAEILGYKPKPFTMPQNGCHEHMNYVLGCDDCKKRYPMYEYGLTQLNKKEGEWEA